MQNRGENTQSSKAEVPSIAQVAAWRGCTRERTTGTLRAGWGEPGKEGGRRPVSHATSLPRGGDREGEAENPGTDAWNTALCSTRVSPEEELPLLSTPSSPHSPAGASLRVLSLLDASLPVPKATRSREALWSPWGGEGLRKRPAHLHAQLAATASPLLWNVPCSPLSLCPGRQLRSQVSTTGKAANSLDQYRFKVQHGVTAWFLRSHSTSPDLVS